MTLAFPSVFQQKQQHFFFREFSIFFWCLPGSGKGDLGVAAPESFLTGILSQCMGLSSMKKDIFLEWVTCGNILSSAYLCFSHCEIETLHSLLSLFPFWW